MEPSWWEELSRLNGTRPSGFFAQDVQPGKTQSAAGDYTQACVGAPKEWEDYGPWLKDQLPEGHPLQSVEFEDRDYDPLEYLAKLNECYDHVGEEQYHASTEEEAKRVYIDVVTKNIVQTPPILFDEVEEFSNMSSDIEPRPLSLNGMSVVGFDLEYYKDELTTIQICGAKSCVVYRRPIAVEALNILRDPSIAKVINYSDRDRFVLEKYGIDVCNLLDLNEFRKRSNVGPYSIHKFAAYVCNDRYAERVGNYKGNVNDEYARKDAYYSLLLYLYTCHGGRQLLKDHHHYRLVRGSYQDGSDGKVVNGEFREYCSTDPNLSVSEQRDIVHKLISFCGDRDMTQYLPYMAWLLDYFPEQLQPYMVHHHIPDSEDMRFLARKWIRAKVHDVRSSLTPEVMLEIGDHHQDRIRLGLQPLKVPYSDIIKNYRGKPIQIVVFKACCACGRACERMDDYLCVYKGHNSVRQSMPRFGASIREGPDILMLRVAVPVFVYCVDSLTVCCGGKHDELMEVISQAYINGIAFGYTMCYDLRSHGKTVQIVEVPERGEGKIRVCEDCNVCKFRRYFASNGNIYVKAHRMRADLRLQLNKDVNSVMYKSNDPVTGIGVFEHNDNFAWRVRNPRNPCSCGCTACSF